MTQEVLKLALEALDKYGFAPCDKEEDWQGFKRAITAIKEALANVATNDTLKERVDEIQKQRHEANVQKFLGAPQPEHKCNSHPKAPHGFNRNASYANDRYTCECESWDAYEAGYQAGVTAGIEMSTETEQKPVAWLGFNERGECREVFTPKMKETFPNYPTADMIPVYTTPPQRTWVGLDHHDKKKFSSWLDHKTDDEVFTAIEAKLKELNDHSI